MSDSNEAVEASDAFDKHQWTRRDSLIYKLRLSALYHQKRARYYELADKIMQATAVLGSAAAVIQLLADNRTAQLWASAIVAVVSTLLLVYTPSAKANVHGNMVRDYRKLLACVHGAGEYPKAEDIDRWTSECVACEAQEPCALGALVSECQFQLGIGTPGGTATIERPALWQRMLMHLIDFAPRAKVNRG